MRANIASTEHDGGDRLPRETVSLSRPLLRVTSADPRATRATILPRYGLHHCIQCVRPLRQRGAIYLFPVLRPYSVGPYLRDEVRTVVTVSTYRFLD